MKKATLEGENCFE